MAIPVKPMLLILFMFQINFSNLIGDTLLMNTFIKQNLCG